MKFTKKNMLAIGAAVMMTASLATFASAASNIPTDTNGARVEAIDVELTTIAPDSVDMDGNCTVMARASVMETDVDLSGINFSEIQDGVLVEICTIDPDSIDMDGRYTVMARSTEAGIASVQAVDVDLSTIDISEMLEGTPVAIGIINPENVTGGYITASSPAEKAD